MKFKFFLDKYVPNKRGGTIKTKQVIITAEDLTAARKEIYLNHCVEGNGWGVSMFWPVTKSLWS